MTTTPNERTMRDRVRFQSSYLSKFEEKLFYEGPYVARRRSNFYALLGLATMIATVGVLSNSTATVIGAMIVAPLMGPIMASAAAVVMGSLDRLWRSLLMVLSGIVMVIFLSWLFTFIIPDVSISFTDNGEITSRITPGLLALLGALASGAAGAFIMSREELADSMGGVAIAISLVPPLCVVGIALNQGQIDAALGALLLFTTNFVAILFAGGITFLILGLGGVFAGETERRTRRRATMLIAIATLVIAIPLGITSWNAVNNALATRSATQDVTDWASTVTYRVVDVIVRENSVIATIEGAGDMPPVAQLAQTLADTLGHSVVVSVRAVPAQVASSED